MCQDFDAVRAWANSLALFEWPNNSTGLQLSLGIRRQIITIRKFLYALLKLASVTNLNGGRNDHVVDMDQTIVIEFG